MRQPTLIRFCEGRKALRPPCRTTHQFRTRHQYEHRQSPEPHDPTHAPRPRRRGDRMRRRAFIGGLAAAWPLAARGQQQADRMRSIGVLMASAADDSDSQARIAGLLQGLQQLGWVDGRNVRIDIRWATTNADEIRKHAAELVATAPEVVVAAGTVTVAPLLQVSRTQPIVFAV